MSKNVQPTTGSLQSICNALTEVFIAEKVPSMTEERIMATALFLRFQEFAKERGCKIQFKLVHFGRAASVRLPFSKISKGTCYHLIR